MFSGQRFAILAMFYSWLKPPLIYVFWYQFSQNRPFGLIKSINCNYCEYEKVWKVVPQQTVNIELCRNSIIPANTIIFAALWTFLYIKCLNCDKRTGASLFSIVSWLIRGGRWKRIFFFIYFFYTFFISIFCYKTCDKL